ncbi:MAG: DUF429 domain-containing protein [bacterium]
MTAFIGLDLAWTAHHESGICVIEGSGADARLKLLAAEIHTPEWFAALCRDAGRDVVAAIDAPLIVQPERRAERELATVFGRAKAGAYSANLPFLTRMNGLAGPNLAALLAEDGFNLNPAHVLARCTGRFALEVFPHPAHVELFSLAERLPYKKGRIALRREGFVIYQDHLRTLLSRELPAIGMDERVQWLLSPEAVVLGGKALKRVEDQLDALTCAYVAHHCWTFGVDGFRVFGDPATGTITVPKLMPRI